MNKLTKLLNIKYPIIQGAMAWISESGLVSAVCNAGGTGAIASGGRTANWVKEEIVKTKKLTDKAFGVNIMLMADNVDEIIDVVCSEKVAFVTLGAGNPVPHFEKFHENGIMCIPVVPSLKLAKRVEEKGADAVIVEGSEAGGHIGSISTMSHMTNIIPYIDIPVIIAGGIADGRGIAAALLMGASGVQLGSRFMLASEAVIHEKAKAMIINATDTDTVVTGITKGHGVRGLKNEFTSKYLKLEFEGGHREEMSAISKGTNRIGVVEGETEKGIIQVGQSLLPLDKIESVSEIIEGLVSETREALD
ncbi:MAG: nitronate monooxygenase, partial [Acidaminobacteraceae bacterium]